MDIKPAPKPEPFYKEEFCRAITGYNQFELCRIISNTFVDDIDMAVGRDMPRSTGEKITDRLAIFMSSTFKGLVLRTQDVEELYQIYKKFSEFERSIHPRPEWSLHQTYWEPAYKQIEQAYIGKDEKGLIEGIEILLDKILHD